MDVIVVAIIIIIIITIITIIGATFFVIMASHWVVFTALCRSVISSNYVEESKRNSFFSYITSMH